MLKKVLLLFLLILLITLVPDVIYYGKSYLQITNFQTYDSNLEIDKENNLLYKTSDEDIKILQLSDIQIDNYKESIDPFTKIKTLIKRTKPHLIVLTGDNLDNPAEKKHFEKLVSFMDSFEIPWAPVYGNHDHWAKVSIKEQNTIFENSENCLFKTGDITNSNGNYYYTIMNENNALYSLIFMDSMETGFTTNHTTWYEKTIKEINSKNNKNVPSMLFFHIPLPELNNAYEYYELNPSSGDGYKGEAFCLQEENVGMFNKIIELNSTKILAFGHDHINTLHVKYKDVMFCYGLKTGYTSYYDENIQGGCLYTITNSNVLIDRKYI